ncbi:MAG TPA: glycoside hydrolase family 104 protein [Candidatus Obscuribacterales bacterium]
MKAISSVLLKALTASPIASAAVAVLLVTGGTISPRAIAQTAPQAPATVTSISSATDKYISTGNVTVIDVPPPSSPTPTPELRTTTPELKAFLDVISWAETGTTEPISYQTLVFNGFFNNFSTHPKIKQCKPIGGRRICSTAAGRYQIMGFNWDALASKLQLQDFSPESQDKMALYFIQRKGAMPDVLAGRFEKAACKVGGIWASFPCNSYGQHPKSMRTLKQFYQQRLSLYKNSTNTFSTLR